MSSPTQGAWVCRHGVDGRDWCPDCFRPVGEPEPDDSTADGEDGYSLLDPATGKARLLSRQCSTCVGRPGNLMHLREGGLKNLVQSNTGPHSLGLICHQTLSYGDHPRAGNAYCRWFYDTFGHLANGIRVFQRILGIIEVDPPEKED